MVERASARPSLPKRAKLRLRADRRTAADRTFYSSKRMVVLETADVLPCVTVARIS